MTVNRIDGVLVEWGDRHFYGQISKSGRLPFEDDRGVVRDGSEALRDLVDQWRCGGGRIPERSERRESSPRSSWTIIAS